MLNLWVLKILSLRGGGPGHSFRPSTFPGLNCLRQKAGVERPLRRRSQVDGGCACLGPGLGFSPETAGKQPAGVVENKEEISPNRKN